MRVPTVLQSRSLRHCRIEVSGEIGSEHLELHLDLRGRFFGA
jgi:hypothetical protein